MAKLEEKLEEAFGEVFGELFAKAVPALGNCMGCGCLVIIAGLVVLGVWVLLF